MHCIGCGKKLDATAQFCDGCGHEVGVPLPDRGGATTSARSGGGQPAPVNAAPALPGNEDAADGWLNVRRGLQIEYLANMAMIGVLVLGVGYMLLSAAAGADIDKVTAPLEKIGKIVAWGFVALDIVALFMLHMIPDEKPMKRIAEWAGFCAIGAAVFTYRDKEIASLVLSMVSTALLIQYCKLLGKRFVNAKLTASAGRLLVWTIGTILVGAAVAGIVAADGGTGDGEQVVGVLALVALLGAIVALLWFLRVLRLSKVLVESQTQNVDAYAANTPSG